MDRAGQQCSSAWAAQWQFLCSFLKHRCLQCPLKPINQDPWGWAQALVLLSSQGIHWLRPTAEELHLPLSALVSLH